MACTTFFRFLFQIYETCHDSETIVWQGCQQPSLTSAVATSCSTVYLLFITDYSVQLSGFAIRYWGEPGTCDDHLRNTWQHNVRAQNFKTWTMKPPVFAFTPIFCWQLFRKSTLLCSACYPKTAPLRPRVRCRCARSLTARYNAHVTARSRLTTTTRRACAACLWKHLDSMTSTTLCHVRKSNVCFTS